MTTKSRAESTRELTILAFSWLFMRRRCRAMADEVGLGGLANHLAPFGSSHWRADVAGIARIGNQYRIDVVEVKGSRADARRENMSEGKWELLPQGGRLNGWLLVTEDMRPEDYAGLPSQWGVLQATANNTVIRTIRKPRGTKGFSNPGEIMLDPGDAAPDIFTLSYRTLTSRLPFLGHSTGDAVAKLSKIDNLTSPESYLGWDEPVEPLPAVIPGGIPNAQVLDLNEARTYPITSFINIPDMAPDALINEGALVPIRGLDKKIIGYGSVRSVPGGFLLEGSIEYSSGERLLLETAQGRPASSMSAERGLTIEWQANGQS